MTIQGFRNQEEVFDSYANYYRETINQSISLSGEQYEYFIDLRVRMMSKELQKYYHRTGLWTRKVLDFGCGIGATAPFLARAMPGAEFHGVDISGVCIAVAQARSTGGTEFAAYDGKTLPYLDNTFDVIYQNGVMHHIPFAERYDVLREIWRIMTPGGIMFLFENNPLNPLMVRAMRGNLFDEGTEAIRLSELTYLAFFAGFRVVESWYYCFFPRFLKFMRPLEPKIDRLPIGAQYCLCVTK